MPLPSRSRNRFSLVGALSLGAAAVATAWYADARRREHKAARIHRLMVDILLNVLSADDPFTERHSRRVAALTDVLAANRPLGRLARARLRIASLLHDMGKVDDRFFDIIHSSEPLGPEARSRIKGHPHESAHILAPLDRVYPGLSRIVESHHECWAGGGYPRSIKGEEIPVEARMITVADVFDALTQPRLYKKALSIEEALKEIRNQAGKRFDPEIVQRLDDPEVLQKWRAIAMEGRSDEEKAQAGHEPERPRSRDAGG